MKQFPFLIPQRTVLIVGLGLMGSAYAHAKGDADKMRAMMRRSTDNRRAFDRQAK